MTRPTPITAPATGPDAPAGAAISPAALLDAYLAGVQRRWSFAFRDDPARPVPRLLPVGGGQG